MATLDNSKRKAILKRTGSGPRLATTQLFDQRVIVSEGDSPYNDGTLQIPAGSSPLDSPTPSDLEYMLNHTNIRHVVGQFEPPGGVNDDSPPDAKFGTWPYLPPSFEPELDTDDEGLATVPPRIIQSIPGIPVNTVRDTPSPPDEQTLGQSPNFEGGGAFSTPREPNGDLFIQGPPNSWKPYKSRKDSRDRYWVGSMFPQPNNGFTNDEEDDFKNSVVDFWKRGEGDDYTPNDLWGWVGEALWLKREVEKMEYWIMFKMPPGLWQGVDARDLGPEFAELAKRIRDLDIKTKAAGAGAGAGDESMKSDTEKEQEKPKWQFREIEPGESAI